MREMVHPRHHHFLVRQPSSSTRMYRPVIPDSPLPPGTPYQNPDPAYATCSPNSHLLSFKNRNSFPVTSQTVKHDVNRQPLSTSTQQRTSKFMPRRNGSYVILSQRSITTFEVANLKDPDVPIGFIRPQHYVLIKIHRLSF
ncbi:hypothetical protein TNIN_42001 [Trichonephila inaurata madagascariensis]|uniref:Uncharacterized protein n=1 Tax=Trichonephila inaurata madagascariensis TaxID=2747483 RepID=A0A8X7CN24_9ARAC|nr:hypothetical protein TNIN_468391 [Trichonephila inaurata madagascariensis]GFY74076.1 hypothetical protein TNIN_42001 [Trichonephila inaurata madagascariensis]